MSEFTPPSPPPPHAAVTRPLAFKTPPKCPTGGATVYAVQAARFKPPQRPNGGATTFLNPDEPSTNVATNDDAG